VNNSPAIREVTNGKKETAFLFFDSGRFSDAP
jgi:hypothetical protein